MKKLLEDFKAFLLQGNLITLATAVIMGTVFAAVIKALIADILTPIIALIVGKPNFGGLKFTINSSHFYYGDFINVALTFVFTATAVFFFIIKPYELFAKKEEKEEEAITKDCPECLSTIPLKATRCPACTSQLTAAA